jgi:predicted nuclease of restriction endonuclease-like RecB superfamily
MVHVGMEHYSVLERNELSSHEKTILYDSNDMTFWKRQNYGSMVARIKGGGKDE